MSPKKSGHKMLPKSVRLTKEEAELLRQISEAELISEAALMRKFVLEGLWHYRLDQAIKRYQEGELDLSSAAQVAGLAIREFMGELHRRGGARGAAPSPVGMRAGVGVGKGGGRTLLP